MPSLKRDTIGNQSFERGMAGGNLATVPRSIAVKTSRNNIIERCWTAILEGPQMFSSTLKAPGL